MRSRASPGLPSSVPPSVQLPALGEIRKCVVEGVDWLVSTATPGTTSDMLSTLSISYPEMYGISISTSVSLNLRTMSVDAARKASISRATRFQPETASSLADVRPRTRATFTGSPSTPTSSRQVSPSRWRRMVCGDPSCCRPKRSVSEDRPVTIVMLPTWGCITTGWTLYGGQRAHGGAATVDETEMGASERSAAAGRRISIVSGRMME